MLNLFICGSNFHHLQEEEIEEDHQPMSNKTSPSSTPRKSRSRNSQIFKTHNNKDKNPYSNIGLDKFSALLSDLEEKRQRIYAHTGDQDKTFVRFVYNKSNDCVPIVVKLKEKKVDNEKPKIENFKVKQIDSNSEPTNLDHNELISKAEKEINKEEKKNNNFSWRRPSYYLPVVMIFILLFLAVFGRSATILCTSIGWYIVPTLKESSKKKRSNTKKSFDHGAKKFSEQKLVIDKVSSPKSNQNKAGHRKSW